VGAGLSPHDTPPNIVIVDQPFPVDENEAPFGKRWGGELFVLTNEHLAALQAGKTLALDVQNEYVTFVQLDRTADREAGRADGPGRGARCADQAEAGGAGV
jgi:hypothetical protein